jgi:hypothetical protein
VNTPAPQGSTGITTNIFPGMTLGCGAEAGNITSDNVGPQHLINIKRLSYVVRKPEEAFQMPLDINQAPAGPPINTGLGPIDRGTLVAAVERYLESRGIAIVPPSGGPSCTSSCAAPAPALKQAAIANPTADVVDRFLASRSAGARPT